MYLGIIQLRLIGVGIIGVACTVIMASTSATATVSVRIRSKAAMDYDLSSEVVLRGQVFAREKDILVVRLPVGIIRVDTGAWNGSPDLLAPGTAVEVVAAKRQDEGRQRFIAREIRYAGGTILIRNAEGVPLQL